MLNPANGHPIPVGAIGGSAGGREACSALLKILPGDMQMAFVLVLHLAPTHDSMVVDLPARDTKLKVVPAADGMALRPANFTSFRRGSF